MPADEKTSIDPPFTEPDAAIADILTEVLTEFSTALAITPPDVIADQQVLAVQNTPNYAWRTQTLQIQIYNTIQDELDFYTRTTPPTFEDIKALARALTEAIDTTYLLVQRQR